MKWFKMDKLTYYYQINKERLQHLNGINQDYYMKWFNINEEAYNLGSLGILINVNDLLNLGQI